MVDFRGPLPPGGGPQYAHASKERRGAAERKKNQERKSQEGGKRYKRNLNTQAARGPANCKLFKDVLRMFFVTKEQRYQKD